MFTTEYTDKIPDVFMKRGGIDRRGHFSATTGEMLRFMESDSPYCMLTCDDIKSAKLAANSAGQYAKNHNIGCKICRRENYVLFIKNGGAE